MTGRKVPKFKTDEEAEAFLMQDLSDLDFSQFKRMHFNFEKNDARFSMSVPQWLLDEIKLRAGALGISQTRYIRMLMERDIAAK